MKFEDLIKEVKFEVEFGGVKLAPALTQTCSTSKITGFLELRCQKLRHFEFS